MPLFGTDERRRWFDGGRRQLLLSLSTGHCPQATAGDEQAHWIRVHCIAMACRFEIVFGGEDLAFVPAARAALDDIDALEDQLSVFRNTSAISEVNRRAACRPVVLSRPLYELLATCKQLHAETDGAFDITTTPLSRCWGFLRREARLPEPDAIEAARSLVGFDAVRLDCEADAVSFERPGLELNLGAIDKGYALDRASLVLRKAGVSHALLSAGRSSLLALGGRDGGWRIDLVSPLAATPIAELWLRDAALGTSGAGNQFVIPDGRRYGHVIDPRTGWPAGGVLSASVVADDAARADALSTAFLIGGADLARRYCAEHPDVLALVTLDDGSGRVIVIGEHPGVQFAGPRSTAGRS